jgi:RNA polymerase sigma factor (sigma-70 family)
MPNRAPTATTEELLAHVGWARRLARQLTADADEAEDLLQETWMAATLHPPTTDRPLRPWLAVVLRNLWGNRKRAAQRREARHATLASEGAAVSPERLAERVEAQRLLAELVARLEEPYRQTLILRYFEELSGAEMARRLGIPAGTVRWRLKVALDELRRRLDERHGGRRESWSVALLPVAGPGAAIRPRPWWPLASGLVGATLVLGLIFARCSADRPSGPGPVAAPAAAGNAASMVARARLETGDAAACRLEVQRLRVQRAAMEVERRARLEPEELFWYGEPNPVAFATLNPGIERAFQGRPQAPGFSLECRTWACRVLLVAPTRDDRPWSNDWHNALMHDEEVRERTLGMGLSGGSPTKDHGSGEGMTEEEVFLPLHDPSGGRRDRKPPAARNGPEMPLPETASACLAERDRLRLQIRQAREDIEARAAPDERFARGAPNPRLAAEVRRHMVAVFPKLHTATLAVECRGSVCSGRWPTGPLYWSNELRREPWFRTMTENIAGSPSQVARRKGGSGEVYLVMATGPRADGGAFLRDLVDRFEKSAVPDDCAARFPESGSLHVRFELRRSGQGDRQGEPARLSARFGNTLAGTPLGRCLETEIEHQVLAAPLPALPVGDAVVYRQLDFPRGR